MKKRLLSVLLAVAMVLSMTPTVFASGGGTEGSETSTIDLDQFIKNVAEANYDYDGQGITVKWSPVSGCYDTREGHECTVNKQKATGNTPKRVNSDLTQFQLYEGESHNVTIKNVNFIYKPAEFTVCENSNWKGSFKVSDAHSGQLYLMNTGDVTFEGCTFDKTAVTSFNCLGTTTVKNCKFSNTYNSYAIKDVRGKNIIVTGNTIENCSGGIMLSATAEQTEVKSVNITDNIFNGVDVADTAPENKIGTRALIQIASDGDYSKCSFDLDGNKAENCGPVMRQLNGTVKHETVKQLESLVTADGASKLYTTDSLNMPAATVDGIDYETLDAALAHVDADHPLTSVSKEAWPEGTPVYYDGKFYATIAGLLYDAQQKKGVITPEANIKNAVIYCRPGAVLSEPKNGLPSHPSYVTSTTIYGNGATLRSSTEWDVENYYDLTKDITINIYNLNGGASVWGNRRTDHTVTVNMKNCKDAHEVLFNYGSGNGKVEVTIDNCTFLKNGGAAHGWPVSINCIGNLTVKNCLFDGVTTGIAVNVKQPSENGTMTVNVSDCEFKNITGQDSNKGALRVTGQKECTIDLNISGVSFTGTHADPEDITIGNVKSEDNLGVVNYNISGTTASLGVNNIGIDVAKVNNNITSDKTYSDNNIAEDTWAAEAGGKKYISLEKALTAVSDGETVTLLKDIKLNNTVEVSKDITLELGNNVITCSGDDTYALSVSGNVTINAGKNGGIKASAAAVKVTDNGKLSINNGIFNGSISTEGDNAKISISGGMFAEKFNEAYCADGLTLADSGNAEYPWTVSKKSATKAEVAAGQPKINEPDISYAENSDEKKLLDGSQTVLKATPPAVSGNGIDTAAVSAANSNTETVSADVLKKLNDKIGTTSTEATSENTTIVIQTYMDIKITGVNADTDKKSISLDIQPMYRTVATTADVKNNKDIVLENEDGKSINAVEIAPAEKLNVREGYPVEITIPLPTGFTESDNDLVVKHMNGSELKGYHKATYDPENNTITFTNDKGFSTFTIMSDSRKTSISFSETGDKSYDPSNVNDALPVPSDIPDGKVFSGWTLKTSDGKDIEGASGTYTTLTDELLTALSGKTGVKAEPVFNNRHSSSSGSSDNTYSIKTSAVSNGSVKISASSAVKGADITVTVSPDNGYKLDKLKITDKNGNDISYNKKSETVYTFKMPASQVNVSVSYVKDDSVKTGFTDVSSGDWFASAVNYVTEKEMMNGTGKDTFSPRSDTTRGMIVTILYRLEKQPAASGTPFTDVTYGKYYTNAVAWANANGIVTGYSNGKFGPDDKITREQLAAILYRYAQFKKCDVSVGEDTNILSYDDAQSVSEYAIPALQWACGSGVVTGKSGNKLDSKGDASRAEAAAMLMRFCESVMN